MVGRKLLAFTSTLPFLAKNTPELLKRAAAWSTEEGDLLMRIDIDNFYLEGDHPRMVKGLEGFWESPEDQKLAERVMHYVLDAQHVYDPVTDTTYRVTTGSGMGAIHSGEVSDMVLYNKAEKGYVLSHSVRSRFGLRGYGRFRDDIVVAISAAGWEAWYDGFVKALAPVYTCKLEALSRVSVQILDARLIFTPDHRSLVYAPYLKPSTIGAPLGRDSAHPPGVHSWPIAEMRRLARNSSASSSFLAAKERLLERLEFKGLDAAALSAAQASDPFHEWRRGSQIARRSLLPLGSAAKALNHRMVLNAHPLWLRANFPGAVGRAWSRWGATLIGDGLLPAEIAFGIAWSNPGAPLLLRVRAQQFVPEPQ